MLHYVDEKIDYEYYNTVLDEVLMHNLDRSNLKIVFTPLHGTSITAIPKVLDLAGYKKNLSLKSKKNLMVISLQLSLQIQRTSWH